MLSMSAHRCLMKLLMGWVDFSIINSKEQIPEETSCLTLDPWNILLVDAMKIGGNAFKIYTCMKLVF